MILSCDFSVFSVMTTGLSAFIFPTWRGGVGSLRRIMHVCKMHENSIM